MLFDDQHYYFAGDDFRRMRLEFATDIFGRGSPPYMVVELDDILDLLDSTKPHEQIKPTVVKHVGLSERERITQP
ncbi:hypothetical protein AHF37_11290 [Paragonimus kellicotti]|nr:hypothetical protein AHF37_11290 [Paragonimus kellicotti]